MDGLGLDLVEPRPVGGRERLARGGHDRVAAVRGDAVLPEDHPRVEDRLVPGGVLGVVGLVVLHDGGVEAGGAVLVGVGVTAGGRGRRGGGGDGPGQGERGEGGDVPAAHVFLLGRVGVSTLPTGGPRPVPARSPARPGWHSDNRRRLRVPRGRPRWEDFVSILGTRVLRTEDPAFLARAASTPRTWWTSGSPGRCTSPSSGRPWRTPGSSRSTSSRPGPRPGVVAVVHRAPTWTCPSTTVHAHDRQAAMTRPLLATDTVRFVGEPVAVVITAEADQGEDAAELVAVDYDPLPVVIDPRAAARDEVLLFPEVGTNTCFAFAVPAGRGPLRRLRRGRPPRGGATSGSRRLRWRPAPPRRCGATTAGSPPGCRTRAPRARKDAYVAGAGRRPGTWSA